ncbi:HTH-type transcriptional activator RhaR [Paenibacillus plantiphilus]|uniref:HTH-type transcriptional activator RhaR n=1 Tax=Paenibacillus plantiphilus TaxID=2905650 RepID=A0ABM9CXY3_9BACL|nr:AraC family transcriptional regulator [Paenibacillus plantiphilus]CAH1225716.1 HTH-type transcriptional activator RhaR [Paenibacillus plantiphilus]
MLNIFEIRQERGQIAGDRRMLGSECYTLVWVRFGQCSFDAKGQTIICSKNELLLIPAGCPSAELKGSGAIRDFMLIRFSPASAEAAGLLPILSLRDPLRWVTRMPELLFEKLLLIAEQWSDRSRYFTVMCSALLMELLVTVNREYDEGEKAPSAIQHVERMKQYIEEHYRTKITKLDLGACLRVSPNYAASMFRSITGMTISQYVHMIRMRTAQYMLRHSQLSVQDISEYLGYSDPSFFNRTFKRTVGKLPSSIIAERTGRE